MGKNWGARHNAKTEQEEGAETQEGQVMSGECQECLDLYGAAKCTVPDQHQKAQAQEHEENSSV